MASAKSSGESPSAHFAGQFGPAYMAAEQLYLTSVTEAVNTSASQATTFQLPVLTTTAIRATNESITSNFTSSSPSTTQQVTQGTTTQPSIKVTTTAANKTGYTTTTTQTNGTQLAQNESLDASSTKASSFSSTVSLQKTTSALGTTSLHMTSPTESTTFGGSGNKEVPVNAVHYSSVILPIVITLIVITLSVFSLVALYRMCQKKTPERQENGTEQAQSDKEGVKLLSVKTTSPETGEHSSQGKNKARQLFTPQQ
ncbi:endomucin [Egretta garzetta]|uniref:endomucin n=1 Tax=Egretta garzetta TaxID=188379 RepID=UPI00051EFCA9|nr:endomucin [Egretta garzetta]